MPTANSKWQIKYQSLQLILEHCFAVAGLNDLVIPLEVRKSLEQWNTCTTETNEILDPVSVGAFDNLDTGLAE